MKNAYILKLPRYNTPVVRIENTNYELQGSTMLYADGKRPAGAKTLAIIKVKRNDTKCAYWALKKWVE